MKNAIKRGLIVLIGVILQIGFAISIRYFFAKHILIIGFIYRFIGILICLAIIRNSTKLSNDLSWILLITIFPIFGTLTYIVIARSTLNNKLLKSIYKKEKEYLKYCDTSSSIKKDVENSNLDILKFILESHNPVTRCNKLTYYPFGEDFYPDLIKELKSAQKFIFMEYFIIRDGKVWNSILDILKEKASSNVDVRIMYDDMGSLASYSTRYPRELEKYGIKCISFNKMSPFRGMFMNNRDHRKITVVDGRVGFTGGINLSDEYMNITHPKGVWKDNAVKVYGPAVFNFTITFLTLWNANLDFDKDISKFKYDFSNANIKDDGYIVPYDSSPFGNSLIGEDVYLDIINDAKDYVYIYTPYLIIDTDVINSLIRASKRGVDVKIIVPYIPDKKLTYTISSSYFESLYDAGVKIYKYKPGFIHAKMFVSDDVRASIGTLNLDYRSLYLHFENGVYLEGRHEVLTMKKDFNDTLKSCRLIKKEEAKPNIFVRIWQSVLRLIAPLF